MIQDGNYIIRRVEKSYLKDLRFLYREVSNIFLPLTFFERKLETSFTGRKYIGYLAYDQGDMPAAYYGVFPCFIHYAGRKIVAAQSGDTMTHPRHQGKGLFTKLAKMTYELARQEGIEFVFGFPNKNSYPGFVRKLGWMHRSNMRNYEISVRTFPLVKVSKRLNAESLYDSFATFLMAKYMTRNGQFNNSAVKEYSGGLVHDDFFFRYKKYSRNHILQIGNVLFWVKFDGRLWIGDIEFSDEGSFHKAFEQLKKLCFIIGCSKITMNFSPGSHCDKLLRQHFPSTEGLPIGYLNLCSNIDIDMIHFTGADYDTF